MTTFSSVAGAYAVRLYGVEVARGDLIPDRYLAIDSSGTQELGTGIATKEPVFGLSAFWIEERERERAESLGMTVVDPSTVLGTHLAEVLRSNADQLLGRDQAHELIGFVKKEAPKLVEELIPDKLSLGEVVEVLQLLLKEKVSIRNLRSILEAIANGVTSTKDPRVLSEVARGALARQITRSLCDDKGALRAMVLDRDLEISLRSSIAPDGSLAPEASVYQRLVSRIADTVKASSDLAQTPCLLVANELRRPIRELLKTQLADVPVVAIREIDRQAELTIIGTISAGLKV
ncbi:MAG: FHIPEP family type III secretion protein [Myxococcales bacterium]|nr:FHIPEP family type III secretion protein [Myxococcales bacterium]